VDATAAALEEAAARRKQQRDRIKQRVRELVADGVPRLDIMSRLNISSGYYYRLLGELRKEK
jgi:DNA invertase Pin-like site-specific DNA recombinase